MGVAAQGPERVDGFEGEAESATEAAGGDARDVAVRAARGRVCRRPEAGAQELLPVERAGHVVARGGHGAQQLGRDRSAAAVRLPDRLEQGADSVEFGYVGELTDQSRGRPRLPQPASLVRLVLQCGQGALGVSAVSLVTVSPRARGVRRALRRNTSRLSSFARTVVAGQQRPSERSTAACVA